MIGGDVEQLHPVFRARLDRVHERVPGLYVISGGRASSEQQYLWYAYQRKLADDPNFKWANKAAPPGTSRHEVAEDGWAYAADLGPTHLLAAAHAAVAELGEAIIWPVSGEAWHAEPPERRLPLVIPKRRRKDLQVQVRPLKAGQVALWPCPTGSGRRAWVGVASEDGHTVEVEFARKAKNGDETWVVKLQAGGEKPWSWQDIEVGGAEGEGLVRARITQGAAASVWCDRKED